MSDLCLILAYQLLCTACKCKAAGTGFTNGCNCQVQQQHGDQLHLHVVSLTISRNICSSHQHSLVQAAGVISCGFAAALMERPGARSQWRVMSAPVATVTFPVTMVQLASRLTSARLQRQICTQTAPVSVVPATISPALPITSKQQLCLAVSFIAYLPTMISCTVFHQQCVFVPISQAVLITSKHHPLL